MQELIFRNAKESDFSRIQEIAMEGWLFSYNYLPKEKLTKLVNKYYSDKRLKDSLEKVSAGTDTFIAAQLNKKLIGFCHVTFEGKNGEILKLYIDTNYIGKGIGKQLLIRCERFLRAKNCKTCFTFVNMHKKTGLHFYLRNGFKHIKEKDREDEFKNGKVLWYLEK